MTGKVTFGYLFDFRNPPQWLKPWDQHYAETLDVAAWIEQAGFGGVWVPEHHLANDGYMPSPLVALSAIAARTSRVKLGTWIALAPLYHPSRFASDCAVLDILSGGRLEVGLGIGYREVEYDEFEIDFKKRGSLFDEWLQIVTRLWAGEEVAFAGEHYRLNGVRIMPPAPRGRIPLFIGGLAEKALQRAATYADGYVGHAEWGELYLAKLREQGKDVSQAKVRVGDFYTVVAEDPEQAMEEVAPYFHYVNNSYGEWGGESLTVMSLDEFKTSGTIQVITPEEAIAKYKAIQERVPLKHVSLMKPPGLPSDRFKTYAQLFADKVMPAFA